MPCGSRYPTYSCDSSGARRGGDGGERSARRPGRPAEPRPDGQQSPHPGDEQPQRRVRLHRAGRRAWRRRRQRLESRAPRGAQVEMRRLAAPQQPGPDVKGGVRKSSRDAAARTRLRVPSTRNRRIRGGSGTTVCSEQVAFPEQGATRLVRSSTRGLPGCFLARGFVVKLSRSAVKNLQAACHRRRYLPIRPGEEARYVGARGPRPFLIFRPFRRCPADPARCACGSRGGRRGGNDQHHRRQRDPADLPHPARVGFSPLVANVSNTVGLVPGVVERRLRLPGRTPRSARPTTAAGHFVAARRPHRSRPAPRPPQRVPRDRPRPRHRGRIVDGRPAAAHPPAPGAPGGWRRAAGVPIAAARPCTFVAGIYGGYFGPRKA